MAQDIVVFGKPEPAYSRAIARDFVRKLQGLARANAYEFQRSPRLQRKFLSDIAGRNFQYVDDKKTCGRDDCWSSYRSLSERYGRKGPVLFDCEDGAAALSGYLASLCHDGVYIGLVTPLREHVSEGRPLVSHAISGIRESDGRIRILDPSAWFGMGPFGRPYTPIFWGAVECGACSVANRNPIDLSFLPKGV